MPQRSDCETAAIAFFSSHFFQRRDAVYGARFPMICLNTHLRWSVVRSVLSAVVLAQLKLEGRCWGEEIGKRIET